MDSLCVLIDPCTGTGVPLDSHFLGDEAAQVFVDSDGLRQDRRPYLELQRFPLLTCVPRRMAHYQGVSFGGCTSLMSVAGLPRGVSFAFFSGCTSLVSVTGLPSSVSIAFFDGCSSLKSVTGLPASVEFVYFNNCTTLTSVRALPASVVHAEFRGCTRLRRFVRDKTKFYVFGDLADDPAAQVRTCLRSGIGDRLQERVGPDMALLIGCFVTAGFNRSPQFDDHMETHDRLIIRYTSVRRQSSSAKSISSRLAAGLMNLAFIAVLFTLALVVLDIICGVK